MIAVLLGNGPSARLVDLQRLARSGFASVGLDAFNPWRGADFRPSHYACLVAEAVQVHADAIKALIDGGGVARFLLHDAFADRHPQYRDRENIVWLSDLRAAGVLDAGPTTSEAGAVRWMAHERKRKIFLAGVADDQAADVEALHAARSALAADPAGPEVIDLSPTSAHGLFPRRNVDAALNRRALSVITSFHLNIDDDVLTNNVRIAVLNAQTFGVREVSVLLEGALQDLYSRLDPALARTMRRLIERGAIRIVSIDRRPHYGDLFGHANAIDAFFCAITNSDIYLPQESVDQILSSDLASARTAYVLTRWNVTANGLFIQAMDAHPPWSELGWDEHPFYDRNYFTYDAYVFRGPIAIPPETAQVLIGSLACDTTLAALLRLQGYQLANPCRSIRIAHFDEKIRAYDSDASIALLLRNVEAVGAAITRCYPHSLGSEDSVRLRAALTERRALWFGHAQTMSFDHGWMRALGATVWSDDDAPVTVTFETFAFNREDLVEERLDFGPLVRRMETGQVFVQWLMTGFADLTHPRMLLHPYQDYNLVTRPFASYQWQSVRHIDQLTAEEVALHEEADGVLRSLICIADPTLATRAVRRLGAEAEQRQAQRMAAVMRHGLGRLTGALHEDITAAMDALDHSAGGHGWLLMIDPDGLDDFGHFLAYDTRLQEAAGAAGWPIAFLLNARIVPEHIPADAPAYPLLDAHSWEVANGPADGPEAGQFEDALRRAVEDLRRRAPGEPIRIYLYCGGFEHARRIYRVAGAFDDVTAVVHLFWLSVEAYKSTAYIDQWAWLVRAAAQDGRLQLTVATDALQALVWARTGVRLPVSPHPSTTFADGVDLSPWDRSPEDGEPLAILFPGGMRPEKGFETTLGAIARLRAAPSASMRFVVAARAQPGTPPALLRDLEALKGPDLAVESRVLDQASFIDFLAGGDIVVLPYKAEAFAERPSGLFVDAVLLGRPLVAVEGTWFARIVQANGWGVVAKDDAQSLAEAVGAVAADYPAYAEAVRRGREDFRRRHGWAALLEALREAPAATHPLLTGLACAREDHAEVDETAVVARLLQHRRGPEHVMLDVGAHVGTSAAYFADLGWTIHCFEPDAANRAHLEARFAGATGVTIDPRAVSDRPALGAALFTSEESTGISGLHAFRDSHRASQAVDVTTIEEIAQRRGLDRVDFLKIDVEGFDLSVLKGVPWAALRPDVIEAEFEDAKTRRLGHDYHALCELLLAHGYAVYLSEWHPIIRYGVAHDWRRIVRYPAPLADPEAWGNILAFRDDPGLEPLETAFKASLNRRPSVTPAAPRAHRRRSGGPIVIAGDLPAGFDPGSLGRTPVMALERGRNSWPAGWRPAYLAALLEAPSPAATAEPTALRRTLVRRSALGPLADRQDVQVLESVDAFYEELQLRPVCDVGHAALWAAALGHDEIVLLGVGAPEADGGEAEAEEAWRLARERLTAEGVALWSAGASAAPGVEIRPVASLARLGGARLGRRPSTAAADHASTPRLDGSGERLDE